MMFSLRSHHLQGLPTDIDRNLSNSKGKPNPCYDSKQFRSGSSSSYGEIARKAVGEVGSFAVEASVPWYTLLLSVRSA